MTSAANARPATSPPVWSGRGSPGRNRVPFRALAVALGLAVAPGCADSGATGASDLDELPRFTIDADLRLGSVDDPDYGFSGVNAVQLDRDGQIYVFEATDMQLRVYSPDGTLVRRIGRRGEGPGEFRSSPRVGIIGDTIWTIELSGRRLTLFRRDGSVISASPIQPVSVMLATGIGLVMPVAMRSDGTFMSDMVVFTSARDMVLTVGENDTVPVPRVLFDSRGQPIDTLGWMSRLPQKRRSPGLISIGGNRYFPPFPPMDDPLSTTMPAGRVVIDRTIATSAGQAELRVTRLDEWEDTVYDHTYGYRPRPFDDAVLDSVAWRSARMPGGGIPIINGVLAPPRVPDDSMTVFSTLRSAMDFPAFQPPVQRMVIGEDETIWLMREDDAGPERRWTILDRDGTPVGQVALPRAHYPLWIRGDTFIVVERDEFDVPWVVRYRLLTG